MARGSNVEGRQECRVREEMTEGLGNGNWLWSHEPALGRMALKL
jgi:hypothetical protein